MQNKKKLIAKANREGFISRDKLDWPNDSYWYLWMCELSQWLRVKHGINVYIESDRKKGYYGSFQSDKLRPFEYSDEYLDEDFHDNYDDCFCNVLIECLIHIRSLKFYQ